MANDNETVRDVCAEIYNENYPTLRDEGGYEYFVGDWARMKADRILAAHERDMAAKDAEIAQLVTECNRLKAALKPVLEVNLEGLAKFNGIDCRELLSSVIAEAQRIVVAWDDKNYFWKDNNRVAKKCMEVKE